MRIDGGFFFMGFDMTMIKCKKSILSEMFDKYYVKDVNDLPYEAFEELEKETCNRIFTSRVHILSKIEDKFPYAHDTYVYLDKDHYDLMVSHCQERIEYLKQFSTNDKVLERNECGRFLEYLRGLNPDWDIDTIIYEHDC